MPQVRIGCVVENIKLIILSFSSKIAYNFETKTHQKVPFFYSLPHMKKEIVFIDTKNEVTIWSEEWVHNVFTKTKPNE